ncbi:MAG: amino acid dehydrogenase [marine bacterium B5-7]|nr:MAG: amino acid dehydrogenase [marine bacterium B5-7]
MTVAIHHDIDLPPIQDMLHIIESGDVHIKRDEESGLLSIIAVHSTKRGPAMGGCRCIRYPNLRTAVYDAMRLAKGMSYKTAISGLPLGGAKGVIILPDEPVDRTKLFEAYGRFVDSIGGRYITAMDSGTCNADMDVLSRYTDHCASRTEHGNPAPATAHGAFVGIKAAVKFKLDRDDLAGLTVAIQGVGNVGYNLAKHLHDAGAKLIVSDVNATNVDRCVSEFHAEAVPIEDILSVECDVLSPNALGAIFTEETVPTLQTKIIAGAANNQLMKAHLCNDIAKRDILFAPDYVVNAGGVIHAAAAIGKNDTVTTDDIYDNLMEIFKRAAHEDAPPAQVAHEIALERLG